MRLNAAVALFFSFFFFFFFFFFGFSLFWKKVCAPPPTFRRLATPLTLKQVHIILLKSAKIKLYRCNKHRQNGIFKTAMATSHVSDKIADFPTKCRRQMMYLMFTMVHSNMVWILLQIWISWYQCTSYVYKNIQCKQRTDISLNKLMFFFRLKVQVKQNAPKNCIRHNILSWYRGFCNILLLLDTKLIIGLFIGIKIVAFNKSDHTIIKGVLTAHLSLLVIYM